MIETFGFSAGAQTGSGRINGREENLMRHQNTLFRKAVIAVWLSTPSLMFAQDQAFSLKHGVYVQETIPCQGAPNAAIIAWDGVGFSGPHSSKCTSQLLPQNKAHFQVSTTCLSLGDGTPDPTGAKLKDIFQLRRLSSIRFEMLKSNQPRRTFRWCSAKDID